MSTAYPPPQGLYDPRNEHDGCGVGFLVDLKGRKTHKIVRDAITALINLDHRGACGCEANTGDGAGILVQIPHEFLVERCREEGIELPAAGQYGVGMFFAAPDGARQTQGLAAVEQIVREANLPFLGWRRLRTNNSTLGEGARTVEPVVFQCYIGSRYGADTDRFER